MNRSVFTVVLVAITVLAVTGAVGSAAVMAGDGPTAATAGDGPTEVDDGSVGTPVNADGLEGSSPTQMAAMQVDDQEFDRTYFEITVYENGSATWTFRHERTLESDEITAFEEFAAEFETEETDLYQRFTQQAEGLVELGAERTDREMEATEFNRSAEVERGFTEQGVAEMSFLWEGFAEVDEEGEQIVVGDVFGGLYLESSQQLIMNPEDGLVFTSAQPAGEYSTSSLENANSITWLGEEEFIDGQPRVILEHEDSGGGGWFGSVNSTVVVAAAVLVVSLVIVGAFAWRRSAGTPAETIGTLVRGEEEAGTLPAGTDEEPLTGEELLTDEDYVVTLIRENGGRMKQVDIVDETGWSKSKVSMLLSEMESEGMISKLRVGRENIISLDGFEPEATRSPFEE